MPIQPKTNVGRNELCPCGSRLKFKHCHGDPVKQQICETIAQKAANDKMTELIVKLQIKKGIRCKHGVMMDKKCIDCGKARELNFGDSENAEKES